MADNETTSRDKLSDPAAERALAEAYPGTGYVGSTAPSKLDITMTKRNDRRMADSRRNGSSR